MKIWILTIGILILTSCQNNEKKTTKSNINNYQQKTNEMDIQYAYTILYVNNVSETIEFYNKAFGFEQKFLTPENDYGEILTGNTTIAFANIELANSNLKKGFIESKQSEKPFGIELAFTTSNVDKVIAKAVKNGAEIIEDKVTKPWGQEVGYIRDLNGFLIEICTPIKSE